MAAQRGRKSAAERAVTDAPRRFLSPVPSASSPVAPPCPTHLGGPEAAIWKSVLADYDMASKAALSVLTAGLEAHMRARQCREAIDADGLTVKGRDGQLKPHPLLAAERDARQSFMSAMKTLGLEF